MSRSLGCVHDVPAGRFADGATAWLTGSVIVAALKIFLFRRFLTATTAISTGVSPGILLTAISDRAGGFFGKNSAYTLFMAA